MKLTKFRIHNYKSIIDSGYCELASDITIFVGKNESGKTAVLEALRDFNPEVTEFPQNAFSINGNDALPRVELHFKLTQSDIERMQAAGIAVTEEFATQMLTKGLTVIKDGIGRYFLNDELLSQSHQEDLEGADARVSQIKEAREQLVFLLEGRMLPDLGLHHPPSEIERQSRQLMSIVKSFLPTVKDENKENEILKYVRMILNETKKVPSPETASPLKEKPVNSLLDLLPRFVYCPEFIGSFPFTTPIARMKEVEPLRDFARICGLDLDKIINVQDIQRRINILGHHSAVLNGEFCDYWQQNRIEIVVKPEGDMILFGVKEKDRTDIFKIEQRSKGFQWFLSFYLRLAAQESKNNIILIDEPGMNLHAKAQREILRVLERRIAPQSHVILSTHSPYFINPIRLDRVRLIMKTPEDGSMISNHIPKDVDADTMIPIHTALQMENAGSLPFAGKWNIVVPNMVDYYLLDILKQYIELPDQKEINLIPCPSDGQLEQLVSLLKGFNFDFRVVLRYPQEGDQTRTELKNTFGLDEKSIVYIPLQAGLSTEDLFSLNDFYTFIVPGETEMLPANRNANVLNSQYLRTKNINDVFAARRFHEKSKGTQITLSDKTINAFQEIFNRIILGEKPPAPPAPPQQPIKEELEETAEQSALVEEFNRRKLKEKQTKPSVEEQPRKKVSWFLGK